VTIRSFAAASTLALLASSAGAMEFVTDELLPGLMVVIGAGDIVAGDAERLRLALASADRDDTGNKLLALNSPGGNVGAALLMADVINEIGVSTVVPPGATCASACASVVFVAGEYRVVIDGGVLGMHSCYSEASGEPADWCNEGIAMRAVGEGTAHGSIMAFLLAAGPDDMIYFSAADAECYGLLRYPGDEKRAPDAPCFVAAIQDLLR
jgi:hypothetical protein